MWLWIKTHILKPVTSFFSRARSFIRHLFASDQQPAEHKPLLSVANTSTSSAPVLHALNAYQPQPVGLSDMPQDVLPEIGRHLPDRLLKQGWFSKELNPMSSFVSISKSFYSSSQPQRLLNKFLQYVVFGNQKQADAILTNRPDLLVKLLTQKSTVTDYSSRTIFGTALQIALGAEDVKYHAHEECMTEMLIRHLKKLKNGDKIITKQIQEQFPKGWEEREKERQARDLAELNKVIQTIENAPEDDNCEAAIKAFRDYLDNENQGRGIIRTGKHFNEQLLIEAFDLYDKKFDVLGEHLDSPKNLLFWCKIIGGIQRYVPACLAQAFCQGVYYIVQKNIALDRKLSFQHAKSAAYYPLDSNPSFLLGEHYATVKGAPEEIGWDSFELAEDIAFLQTILSKKQRRCENLRRGETKIPRAATSYSSFLNRINV